MASVPPRSTGPAKGRLPWIEAHPSATATPPLATSPVFRWVSGLALGLLLALAGFLIGRRSDDPPLPLTPPPLANRSAPTTPAPAASAFAPPDAAAPLEHQIAPALARVEAQSSRERAPEPAPAVQLKLRPDQLRAVREIVREREVDGQRGSAPRATGGRQTFGPSAGPSGLVVQLGSYRTVAEAEAAAQAFRYKYRGLLEALPKAVLPFRPAGTRRLFYRVQFVTPSQAYAEVTCQRLRAAAKTCIVLY